MNTLDEQYQTYRRNNPHLTLTYEEWMIQQKGFATEPTEHDDDFQYVMDRIHNEGFHYCFKYYSEFEEIKDEKFHELRLAYLEAADALKKYIYSRLDY